MSQRILEVKKRITEIPGAGSHRLQMWIETYQDIDPGVFVYQRKQPTPPNVDEYDEYVNIASVADQEEYPANVPDTQVAPFFRLTSIDLVFRSVELMYASIQRMEEDLRSLVKNWDYLDEEGTEETITIEGAIFP
jgi:hypothetical protein